MTDPVLGKWWSAPQAPSDRVLAGQARSQRLHARGSILCDSTAELILRSRRAIDRSRLLLGDSQRIVRRANPER